MFMAHWVGRIQSLIAMKMILTVPNGNFKQIELDFDIVGGLFD